MKTFKVFFAIMAWFWAGIGFSQGDQVAGIYKALLVHEDTNFYQFAKLTLRTVNENGQIKVSANLKVHFGDWDSTEFLTYEYPSVPFDFLTRRLTIRNDAADVSLIGAMRNGVIEGDWYSSVVGRVGKFKAQRNGENLIPPEGGILVKPLSGYYRGSLKNENPAANLPQELTMSFVTTPELGENGPILRVTGSVRFYLDFDTNEYFETNLTNINFNFFTRYLTAKTEQHGVTFKGTVSLDGIYTGSVHMDALDRIGSFEVKSH